MRGVRFDSYEPPILDHRLTAAAGNAQRAKCGDVAAFCGHLGIPLKPIMLVNWR
jgi:hypothetical protein